MNAWVEQDWIRDNAEEGEIVLHPGQSEVFEEVFINRSIRDAVVCATRGWGKSFFGATAASTACFELLELDESVPNKNVYIIAPTWDQVTDIYFPILEYELGFSSHCIHSSRDRGRFVLPKNVELRLVSYEAVERMRGKGAYFVLNDEISSWKKGIGPESAWTSVIRPCMATRWSPSRARYFGAKSPGRSITISTPKGYNFFYDMYNFREKDPSWGSFHYNYTQSPYVDPEEVERQRHTMDPIEFASEYDASFEESGNNVFYCFNRNIHVRNDLPEFRPTAEVDGVTYPGEDIHVNIDFNVGIMATSAFALRGKQIHFLNEKKNLPDTENLAIALKAQYIDKGHKVFAYPDPTGNSKKTSAKVGTTDFTILKEHGITVLARKKSPPIIDSVASVNRHLATAAGEYNMFFHPRCTELIKSMERTKWVDNNSDTATIDKSEGVDHFSDGVRYGTEFLFPVKLKRKATARGFGF